MYLADFISDRTREIEKLRENRIQFRQILYALQPIVMKHSNGWV